HARLSFVSVPRPHQRSTLFPYTTLFRSWDRLSPSNPNVRRAARRVGRGSPTPWKRGRCAVSFEPVRRHLWSGRCCRASSPAARRSEEHTSELQSRENLVCRLLLEKKKSL